MWLHSIYIFALISLISLICILPSLSLNSHVGRGRTKVVRQSIPLSMFWGQNKQSNSKVIVSKPKFETIIVPEDYTVSAGFLASAVVTFLLHNVIGGGVLGAIGLLLFIQTGRVRFVFDGEAMEVLIKSKTSESALESSGENFAVGGKNRWSFSSFTSWRFLPSNSLPILMYFKEIQTKPEGQIHFFPVIMKSDVLKELMILRVGTKP